MSEQVASLIHLAPRVNFWKILWTGSVYLFGYSNFPGSVARSACSTKVLQAVFGQANPSDTAINSVGTCVAAASVAAMDGAIAASLAAYGSNAGWQWSKVATTVGERSLSDGVIWEDKAAGIQHYFDKERHDTLSLHYGEMLEKHNTTLMAVSWLEASGAKDHTGTVWQGLNMTDSGRLIALHDRNEDIVHTAFGHIDEMHPIFEAYDEHKTNEPGMSTSLSARNVDEYRWVSFNTYGVNTNLGSQKLGAIQSETKSGVSGVAGGHESPPQIFADFENNVGNHDKYCLAAGTSSQAGKNSIIVGEIYWNRFGGIDNECQSG